MIDIERTRNRKGPLRRIARLSIVERIRKYNDFYITFRRYFDAVLDPSETIELTPDELSASYTIKRVGDPTRDYTKKLLSSLPAGFQKLKDNTTVRL